MLTRMKEVNHSVDVRRLEEFEGAYKLRLPADYKAFLLATNGGRPAEGFFRPAGLPTMGGVASVLDFFGLDLIDFPALSLGYALDLYSGGIPDAIVPIAVDDYGNYTCLDLRSGKEGVAFWEKSHFWSTGEWRESDLYNVADSFDEFLSMLGPDPQT